MKIIRDGITLLNGSHIVETIFSMLIVFMPFFYIRNPYVFVFQLVIVFIYIRHVNQQKKRYQNASLRKIKNLEIEIDNFTRNSILSCPMPMIILESRGRIIWHNRHFENIVENHDVFGLNIDTMMPELSIEVGSREDNDKDYIEFLVDYNKKNYKVIGNAIDSEQKEIGNSAIVLYFVDITPYNQEINTLNSRKSVCCILTIDNYDELLKSNSSKECVRILNEIENLINDWVHSIYGIVNKYETGKYYIVFQEVSLNLCIDDKFSIIDRVRDIKTSETIPATLSIGIGYNCETLSQCDKFARSALDVALGRGGDQVVIRSDEYMQFFGGKTPEIEKHTKVKARAIAGALKELCLSASKIFIMGHESFDADVLGAAIGLFRGVFEFCREIYIVVGQPTNSVSKLFNELVSDDNYSHLFIKKEHAIDKLDESAILIVIDTSRPSYVESTELLEKAARVVFIDHHRRGTDYIEKAVLKYHEPSASSTSEMVTELIQYIGDEIKLNAKEAQFLYAGIVTDTKSFTFKTGVRTFEAASYLRMKGVDTIAVKRLLQSDIDTISRKSYIISKATVYKNCIAISSYDNDSDNANLLGAQAADELLSISGISTSFVLCRKNNVIIISGRSLGDVNVQIILEKIGGGGHLTMAGAQLIDVDMEEGINKLYDAINEYFVES